MNATAAQSAALGAWSALSAETLGLDRIALLRQSRASSVLRIDSSIGSVIAKRSPRATAAVEETVYDRLLRRLELPTLQFHGAVDDDDRQFRWLFIEDAGGEPYRPQCAAHRCAAAHWLASLHCALEGPPAADALPDRNADHYRGLLDAAGDMLGGLRVGLGRSPTRRRAIDALLAQCDRLAGEWGDIAAACRLERENLVHGDIVAHNVRLRTGPEGLEFLPFDWEKAGWGSIAEDLSSVDIDQYCVSAGRQRSVSKTDVTRLAGAGKAFRCLVYLQWLGADLQAESADAFAQLELCRSWLDTIIAERPWQR